MPIYEYYSPATNRIYSFLARGPDLAERVPRCPDDPALPLQRLVSGFAVTRRRSSGGDAEGAAADAAADDPAMARMLGEMEREMQGLDENNPDPRALARMLRKMADLGGGALPDQMEEVVRRLEAGEDPDAIGEELGDLDAAAMPGLDDDPGEDAGGLLPGLLRRARGRRRPRPAPSRDPQLYELAEYI
jgi:hypothetical protein